jgi:hypothetical protein
LLSLESGSQLVEEKSMAMSRACVNALSAVLTLGLTLAASLATARVPGGGPAATDCRAEWQVTTPEMTPNHGRIGVDCEDGDPRCDIDGAVNGACTLGVSVCVAQTGVAACTSSPVTAIALSRRARQLGLTAPALPATTPECGPASIVTLPLRTGRRGSFPSRPLNLALTATAARKDHDRLRLRCVPNRGANQCPANPAGGPRELAMTVAASGTDLDNGWTGLSHNFPVPQGAALRMCLTACDPSTNPLCLEDEAATDQVKSPTFGPPLPLFSAGVPACVVNRLDSPSLTGGTADLATGTAGGTLHLLSDVYLSSPLQVCPRCSASAVGTAGRCDAGRRQGQACQTEAVVQVSQALGNRIYALSSDCPPAGSPVGSLTLAMPLTTGTSTLTGPAPCGESQGDNCHGGTCDTACTGAACVATTSDGQCIDAKGGISQVCCSTDTTQPCFPTTSGVGKIVRAGHAEVPAPAWPDATYPKTGAATLVSTFCEGATGSAVVNSVTGLPGPGALTLPVMQRWVP